MALNTIIRRSASYANRFIASKTCNCSALLPALNHTHLSPFPKLLHYSSSPNPKKPSSDDKLIRVIESEIQCAKDSDDLDVAEEIPDGFCFKIQDNPGQQTIALTREYHGETINVEVFMPDLLTGEDEDEDEDDTDKDTPTHIPLTVSVSKKEDGPFLEFTCHAYRDEITIDNLFIKDQQNSQDRISYEGPDFSDLDESLQKALHKYLEIRGINTTTTTFLHDYMLNKDGREYVVWLNNLKQFVEA